MAFRCQALTENDPAKDTIVICGRIAPFHYDEGGGHDVHLCEPHWLTFSMGGELQFDTLKRAA